MVAIEERCTGAPARSGAFRRVRRALFLGLFLTSAAACTNCKGPASDSTKENAPPPPAAPATSAAAEHAVDPALGRLAWHELTSTNPAASAAFYADLLGWAVHSDGPDATSWLNEGEPVAGIARATSSKGNRSYWTAQVLVDDVDEAVRVARGLGAPIYVEPVDMPNGRFASLGDPKGPQLYVYRPKMPWRLADPTHPGEFFWHEYSTTDGAASLSFYGKLFGWTKISETPVPPSGKHIVFGRNGVPFGVFHADPALTPGWIFYVQILDLDAAIKKATSKGATVLTAPIPVPDGRVAVLTDPQGAVFGLHEPTKEKAP